MSDDRGWRVGHQGRDQMYYEEFRDGAWQRIRIDGEMLMGPAHHVIYFASPQKWLEYPAWARDRRAEIIARITSEFRSPEYEYYGLDGGGAPTSSLSPTPSPAPSRKPVALKPPAGQGTRALLIAVVALFVIAAGAGWISLRGIQRGETTLPVPKADVRRTAVRSADPAMFWVSIGIYGIVAAGTLVLGSLGIRALKRMSA